MRRYIFAFVAGVCVLQAAPEWPLDDWSPRQAGGLLCGLALAAARGLRRWPGVTAFVLGMLWAGWHAQLGLTARLPAALDGAAFKVEGVTVDLPVATPGALHFELVLTHIGRGAHAAPPLRRIALADYASGLALSAGSRCALYVRLRTPRGASNPAGADRERQLFARGIDATGYVIAHPANRCEPRPIAGALDRQRARLAAAIGTSVPAAATGGVLRALGVGERAALNERQWQVLQATGTTHVVSISGLHVSMVAVAVYALVRAAFSLCPPLTRRLPAQFAGTASGLAAAAVYALLAGFTVPTQRTVLMLACMAWQRRRGQRLLNADGLILALGIVIACDPLVVLTASCWLSFGAMAALVALSAVLRDRGLVAQTCGVHLWLALALAPLLAFVTPLLAWTSPLANFVVVPLATWAVVPLVLLGLVLTLTEVPGAAACWQLAAWLWERGWWLLERLADGAPAWRLPYAVAPASAVLVLLGLGLLLLPLGRARGWLVPLLCASPWLAAPAPIPPGEVRVSVFDVGQGLAVLVRTRRHALLYDAGPRGRGGGDAGQSIVVPNLRAAGVWRLDRMMLSHADIDHAGGAAAVLAGIDVQAVTVSPRDPWPAPATRCVAGQGWRWDGVRFDILHPPADATGDDNQQSCVLRVTSAGSRVLLLTGDIDTVAERRLLDAGHALAAEVLVTPHHGSLTSSSPDFVAAVQPRHVVHTAAHGNRYGFPAREVVARYADTGSRQHVTGEHGAVLVALAAGPATVTRWREARRHYWQARAHGEGLPVSLP